MVLVVGAGIGGLVAALGLAVRGQEVTVLERRSTPGGKMRELTVGPARIDAGPTVLTMRWVFESLFEEAGVSLDSRLALRPLDVLARHAWPDGSRLDLFADRERSAEAIGVLAGAREAAGYRAFCARAERIYRTLEEPFIRHACGGPLALMSAVGWRQFADLWQIAPFTRMDRALARYFQDARLRQLFGRYATYCGSSPFRAPATLMLVAHVEAQGVWSIDGGMHRLAQALEDLARDQGVSFRYESDVTDIAIASSRVSGVTLATGEHLPAEAVVLNTDAAALAAGGLGSAAGHACTPMHVRDRSLSAVTWAMVARAGGIPLARHNVFFSSDYAAEFDDIFAHRRVPRQPTVYVCAQDRLEPAAPTGTNGERLLCLVNAPANGDSSVRSYEEASQCKQQMLTQLARCGLELETDPGLIETTTPECFNRLYPGTGGALYGRASHGWMASFRRPGSRTAIAGLYLAGGSVHPGPGVPMAALSGRMAVEALLEDRASISR